MMRNMCRFLCRCLAAFAAALVLLGATELCFEKMPPPADATFSPAVMTLPISPPLRAADLSSPFGYRFHPISQEFDFHYGVDLAVPKNTPIFAAMNGVVTAAKNGKSYGNYLIIDHHNGFSTLYAHCEKLLVKEGDFVFSADKIALAGSTGETTGNHLHFEMKLNGIRLDPLWILGNGETLTSIPSLKPEEPPMEAKSSRVYLTGKDFSCSLFNWEKPDAISGFLFLQ